MAKRSKTEKCMVNLKRRDVCLLKLASMAFILFLITVWPAAMTLVHKIHWGWFLAAAIVLGFGPFMKYLKA